MRNSFKTSCVSFCLLKNILRSYSYFLALNTCKWYPFEEENVISRTILGWVFFNRALGVLSAYSEWNDWAPPSLYKGLVYKQLPGFCLANVSIGHADYLYPPIPNFL